MPYEEVYEQLHSYVNLLPEGLEYSKRRLARIERNQNRTGASQTNSDQPYKHYKIIPIEADKYYGNFIFFMTEFAGECLARYEQMIAPFCDENFSLPAIISRDDHLDYRIDDKIISHIHKCKFTIADISTRNPNVMYEVGYAHAANRSVIIICDEKHKGNKEIFDIRNIPTIFFRDRDQLLLEQLAKKIQAQLNIASKQRSVED